MIEAWNNLMYGFGVALTWENLLYSWMGALLGTFVGVMPGIGVVTAIALLLPLTFKMSAIGAVIMLAGIYYGATHAESTSAIMLNMPAGHPAAIVICFDGYPMAKQGRAGPALAAAALSSFFAGCVCILVIAFFASALGEAAIGFGAPEYTSVIILALTGISVLGRKSMLTTMGMAVIGLLLGTVGMDINSGVTRFAMGDIRLNEGIHFVPVALALFALVDITFTLGSPENKMPAKAKFKDLMPTWTDIKTCFMPVVRGTALGGALGVMPGTGPLMASFASYAMEKKLAKDPSRFGNGAIEGVAAPEASANAAAFTHFIPMLSLGIPAGTAMALMLGALLIHGVAPGPQLITQHPDIFWGLIASMWIGNLMLLVLNLPLVGVWIKMLETPYRIIYPAIVVFCMIGIYSERLEPFGILICGAFVVIGWVLESLDCSPAPLVLAMILGPMLEENFRRSLLLSRGDPLIFFERPVSLGFLMLTLALIILFTLPAMRRKEQPILEVNVAEGAD